MFVNKNTLVCKIIKFYKIFKYFYLFFKNLYNFLINHFI